MAKKKPHRKARSEYADPGKIPRSAYPLETRKQPREAPPADPNARTPVWAFRIVDIGGPWCWTTMSAKEAESVLRRLGSYESMTWREIDGPTGSHGVDFGSLAKKARDRLEAIEQDDAAEYFSLRIDGPGRVWGIREEHVMRILWWDPNHEVCPSRLKHT
ncbi:MAG TPA: hypothetical protein VF092_31680 [Longimicrobium sp.]